MVKKLKKLTAVILSVAITMTMIPPETITAYAAGTGNTKVSASHVWNGKADTSWYTGDKDVYNISTPEQLAGLASLCDKGTTFSNVRINLTNDILLNNTSDFSNWKKKAPKNKWNPIGGAYNLITEKHFDGIFDGNGHTIRGMYIESTEPAGLFASTWGAAIVNVRIEKSAIIRRQFSNYPCGMLVASSDSSYIESCEAKDIVINAEAQVAGGLIGEAYKINTKAGVWLFFAAFGVLVNPLIIEAVDDGRANQIKGTVISNCKANNVKINCGQSWGGAKVGGVIGASGEVYLYNCLSLKCSLANGNGNGNCGAVIGEGKGEMNNCYYNSFKRTDTGKNQYDKTTTKKIADKKLSENSTVNALGSGYEAVSGDAPKVKSLINHKVTIEQNGAKAYLTWEKVKGAKKYKVYLREGNGSFKLVASPSKTNTTLKGLKPGKNYQINIKAVMSKKNSKDVVDVFTIQQ